MTAPAQFTVLREQIITSTPRPGVSRRLVVITYQLAARPPQVIVIPAGELPDIAYLEANPQEVEVPLDLVEAGQRIRNTRIQAQVNRVALPETG